MWKTRYRVFILFEDNIGDEIDRMDIPFVTRDTPFFHFQPFALVFIFKKVIDQLGIIFHQSIKMKTFFWEYIIS